MALLCLAAVCCPAFGAEVQDVLDEQRELYNIDGLDAAARGYLGDMDISIDNDWQANLGELMNAGTAQIKGEWKRAMRSGVLLLIVVLLSSVGESMNLSGFPAASIAGVAAAAAIAVLDVHSLLGLGKETISDIAVFSNVLLPAAAAVSAATGAITGAAAKQMAAVLFSDLLVNLINSFLVPAVYGFAAANVAYAATGNPGLKKLAAFLKWLVVTVLTGVLLAFVGYLGISGIMTGSADAAALKTAKFAISGMVPVVGGILSDASESILASAGILRGTVGVFGMIAVFGLCMTPFLRLAIHYLVYKGVSVLTATVGGGRVSDLIDDFGTAFGLIFGMTGACAMLLLVALVSCSVVVTV